MPTEALVVRPYLSGGWGVGVPLLSLQRPRPRQQDTRGSRRSLETAEPASVIAEPESRTVYPARLITACRPAKTCLSSWLPSK
jgi:hypothetical protein